MRLAAYDAYGRISNWAMPEGTYSSFQYDAEGEPSGFSAGGKSFAFGYSTRGELLSEGQTGATPIAAFRSADGFLYGTTAECGTNRYGVQHCYVPTQSFDPRNGALTKTQDWDSLGYFVYVAITYDLAGRRYGSEYDALNRLYRDGSAYSQGPGTIPENDGSITYHSVLGHTPTWASQNGNVTDVKLGMNNDILPTNTSFSGLTVYDRDPWGYAAAARNATGTSKWTLPNMFSGCDASGNLAPATSGFAGTPMTNCAPGGLLYAYRTDGYFNGSLTFRGVRTYSSDTQQWSSPDLYQGMASDPMSGLGYNYAGNNPAMFADPSGFCQQYVVITDDGQGDTTVSDPFNDGASDCSGGGLFSDGYGWGFGSGGFAPGVGMWRGGGGLLSYKAHCTSSPCMVPVPQACKEATRSAKSAQHDLYAAINAADQRMEQIKSQYADIEITGETPPWVRGMTGLGSLQAIMEQADVIRANKSYKAAERQEYNACPQVSFG